MPINRIEILIEGDYKDFLLYLSKELSDTALFNDERPFFKGRIENHKFKIWRNYMLRGWEPVILGKHLKDSNGSRVLLFIRINFIGLMIFFGGYIYAFYLSFKNGFDFILIASMIFLTLVVLFQFYSESKQIVRKIREINNKSSGANIRL